MTMTLLKSIVMIIVLVYFGLGALLYFFQSYFIYFPSTRVVDNAQQSIRINSQGEAINVWLINPGKSDAVIYFGGNAQNAYYAIPQFEKMITDRTVYLVDYRGYGSSSGKPGENALYADALNIYDHVKPQHRRISVIGQSLGSGIAIYLATRRDIDKLILTTPYDSIESVAKNNYPFYPVRYLLKEKYDALSRAAAVSANTLILIAQKDRIIPKKHAYRLASAFNTSQISIVELPGVGHNTITLHPRYESVITNFLR